MLLGTLYEGSVRFCDPTNATSPSTIEQLAVIAQIRALELPVQRLQRQQEVPVGAHARQALFRLAVKRLGQVRPVVHEHPHVHAARDGFFHRHEESLGGRVALEDVELNIHVRRRRTDRLGHLVDAGLVVRDDARTVVARQRQGAERAVHLHDLVEPLRRVGQQRAELEVMVRLAQHLVDLGLDVATLLRQSRVTDQQEQEHARNGQEEDQEQPRHGRCGASTGRHEQNRRDTDDHVDDEDDGGPNGRPCDQIHASPFAALSRLGSAYLSAGHSPRGGRPRFMRSSASTFAYARRSTRSNLNTLRRIQKNSTVITIVGAIDHSAVAQYPSTPASYRRVVWIGWGSACSQRRSREKTCA